MAITVRRSSWDPFTALVRQFDADFDSMVRRAFGSATTGNGTGRRTAVTGFVPAADVAKDGSDVVVTLELPGVDVAKDIDVEVTDRRLVVSGRREHRAERDEHGLVVREIRSGEFRREFALPEGTTAGQVEAGYDKGLLTIRVHDVVARAVEPTKVPVRTALSPARADGEATASAE
jgi:HSP20 family protein